MSDTAVSISYMDPSRVIAKRQGDMPYQQTQSGYGNKLRSSWMLQLDDKRWRRVYVICYSNSGSAYIIVDGKKQFLGSYDPSYE